jgi:ABC-type Mn2+/Zn2+ transport system permease subunit
MNPAKPILRTTAFTTALIATIVSVALMLRACRFNASGVALALIAVWILSPMLALVGIEAVAKRWSYFRRATPYRLMLAVASGSVMVYGADLLVPLSPRAGFPYALVPAVSWLLIVIVLVLAAIRTRARAKNHLS